MPRAGRPVNLFLGHVLQLICCFYTSQESRSITFPVAESASPQVLRQTIKISPYHVSCSQVSEQSPPPDKSFQSSIQSTFDPASFNQPPETSFNQASLKHLRHHSTKHLGHIQSSTSGTSQPSTSGTLNQAPRASFNQAPRASFNQASLSQASSISKYHLSKDSLSNIVLHSSKVNFIRLKHERDSERPGVTSWEAK